MNWKLHITTSVDYLIRFYQYDKIYTSKDFNALGPHIQIIDIMPFCSAARLADMALSNESFIRYDNKMVAAACYSKISFVDWSEECTTIYLII